MKAAVCILVQLHHNIVLLLIDVNGGSLFLTSLPLFLSASHCQSLWLCVFGLPTALDSAQINTELSLVLVGLGGLLCSIALFFFSLFSLFFFFFICILYCGSKTVQSYLQIMALLTGNIAGSKQILYSDTI